jgi:ketosteroid isomerase-like protein
MEILRKQRAPVTALAVTGTYARAADTPRLFQAIHIHYAFTGRLDPAHVRRAIELTEHKYCSIHATLRDVVALSSDFEIVEGEIGEGRLTQISSPISTPPQSAAGVVLAFNDALNAGDVDDMMALLTLDCVFENTFPPPDGTRYEGHAAVRAFWEEFFRASRQPHLEYEEIIHAGDRVVLRWTYRWLEESGQPGHVRGVDVYRLRDGLIAEKLSYVKG